MKTFIVTNVVGGKILNDYGHYQAEDAQGARDQVAREYGCADEAEMSAAAHHLANVVGLGGPDSSTLVATEV